MQIFLTILITIGVIIGSILLSCWPFIFSIRSNNREARKWKHDMALGKIESLERELLDSDEGQFDGR